MNFPDSIFLSFARQEPNCTFQPRALARSSSSARSSFCFSLDWIIFQPGLLPAPILKISFRGIYEQPREWLRCCKALLLCQPGCPLLFLLFLDLISSHPHGSRQRSCHWFCCIPNFCKLLGATFFHSGLSFRVLPQCEDTCEFWGRFRGVWIPWGTAFPALSSTFATVGLPTND